MKVDIFDFDLPSRCIAQAPCRPRDAARLLRVKADGGLADAAVRDLPDLLREGDVMVFNDTKVIPARLTGRRHRRGAPSPGPSIEVTLHKCNAGTNWHAFARPGRKLRVGDVIEFARGFSARVDRKPDDGEITLAFDCSIDEMRQGLLDHGIMPLPPYIKRPVEGCAGDRLDYQTVYAAHEGAVATPTAGLHFTNRLLAALDGRRIERVFVTLHVGAGTFLPVRADDTDDHEMHAEWGEITPDAASRINRARRSGGRVVSVGTTALRLLESAADTDGVIHPCQGETDIFITPGYRFRAVDVLMTNFHLPRSTLFMLVSAFAGRETMGAAYRHAIGRGYRFYSYGDASLLERQ